MQSVYDEQVRANRKREQVKKWHQEHPDRIKEIRKRNHNKRITFKNDRIILTDCPRTFVCSKCGKKWPDDLKERTIIHHVEYDASDPLNHTIELCRSCHSSLHARRRVAEGTFYLNRWHPQRPELPEVKA